MLTKNEKNFLRSLIRLSDQLTIWDYHNMISAVRRKADAEKGGRRMTRRERLESKAEKREQWAASRREENKNV